VILCNFRYLLIYSCILIINLAKLSDWGMFLFPCHSGYRNVVCCKYKHIDHFQPHNNFPAQSFHFRFGSVAPCPTLKSDVTVSTPRTRYRRLARPYPTGFSCYIQSAYKSKQSFLRSPEEISLADFSARTIFELYKKLPTGSCPELSRSPRYVEYNYIRYAVLWDSGVFS
jgi:hypothetical protein